MPVDGGSGAAALCPSCGEELSSLGRLSGATARCRACGRPSSSLHEGYYGIVDAVEYDFDDSTPAERVDATDLLVGAGIAYRWDPGYRLQVPPERETDVDVLFGHDADDAEAAEDGDGSGRPTGGQEDADDPVGWDPDDEPPAWRDDEAAVTAQAELYSAADRLAHHPLNDGARAELADATGVVCMSSVPIGVNAVRWKTTQHLARQLLDLIEAGADSDDLIAGAEALRAVLRDHV
jgi:hypothetical protein